jgi:hypothetical protein
MQYAAMTFWLTVIVFSALGVHRLWSGLVKPRVVNSILLPGTLVAQIGRVVGLLVTGGTVENTALITDDESGEPQTGGEVKPRIPVVGPVVIAMLPLLACGVAIYAVSQYLGRDILNSMSRETVWRELPVTLSAVWAMLRDSITLVERLVDATLSSQLADYRTWVFLYLAVCLTVRMAPLPGTLRGAIGAIFVLGVMLTLLDLISSAPDGSSRVLERSWPLITFSAATLLFLLLASLVVRGGFGLVRVLFGQEQGAR